MTKSVAIIGCGSIGSRHLQAISKLTKPLNIQIVEPNIKSIKIAYSRLKQISNTSHHNYSWIKDISQINKESDLTIISTSSHKRTQLIDELIEKGHNRFLIEKIVCQSKKEYDHLIKKIHKRKIKGWVNLARHYFPFYQHIVPIFQKNHPIMISVTGGNLGLGTNTIHFIDLFSWILKSSQIKLTGKYLNQKIHSNKRGSIFKEFSGTIVGFQKNSILSVTSYHNSTLPLMIDISNSKSRIVIDEINEKIYFSYPKMLNKFKFAYSHVSDTSTPISRDILFRDNCALPTISDSYYSHLELFKILNSHISNITNQKPNLCPIT